MNLSINEGITQEVFDKLIIAYNELEEKGIPQLNIFFSSNGGDSTVGEAIIELINRYRLVTTVTAYSFIQSMGFDIFFKVDCPRIILPGTIGMIHLHRWNMDIKDGGTDLDYFDTFKKNYMKSLLPPRLDFYTSIGITDKETEWILKGEDLFVDAKRLNKMIKIQEKNNR